MTDTPNAAPIILLESDLFFVVKLREPLRLAGRVVQAVKTTDAVLAALATTPTPQCLIVHIGGAAFDWQAAIQAAHAAGVPVLAYGSHVDTAAQQTARTAGATRVIANSKLTGDLLAQVDRTIARVASTASDAE